MECVYCEKVGEQSIIECEVRKVGGMENTWGGECWSLILTACPPSLSPLYL